MHKLMAVVSLLIPTLVEAAPTTSVGLDRIAAYAGSWRTVVHHLDTPYSKAGGETHLLRNDCWRSGGFYGCDQLVDGDSKALVVFLYDPKTDRYSSYAIPAGGAPDVKPGALVIVGDTWIFPWESREQGKVIHFRVVNVWQSPDRIDFRQEYSADGVHWTIMAQGSDRRIKAGA